MDGWKFCICMDCVYSLIEFLVAIHSEPWINEKMEHSIVGECERWMQRLEDTIKFEIIYVKRNRSTET